MTGTFRCPSRLASESELARFSKPHWFDAPTRVRACPVTGARPFDQAGIARVEMARRDVGRITLAHQLITLAGARRVQLPLVADPASNGMQPGLSIPPSFLVVIFYFSTFRRINPQSGNLPLGDAI